MGLLVRFVLAPSILFPFLALAAPILLLFMCTSLFSGVVGLVIDLIVIAAEQLQRQRPHIEAAASYMQLVLGWLCRSYMRWLLQALKGTEGVLYGVGEILVPLAVNAMNRLPILVWILSPALCVFGLVSRVAEVFYTFIHDEIVPVALDLAERFPLVEEFLLRYAYNTVEAEESASFVFG